MASYTLIGSVAVTQVIAADVSQPSLVCTIETIPTGIIAMTTVSQADFDSGAAAAELAAFADNIETLIGEGKAIGGTGTSRLGDNGLTAYFVTFVVGYNPPNAPVGTVTADVAVPDRYLTANAPDAGPPDLTAAEALINATYDNLVALAGVQSATAPPPPAQVPPPTPPSSPG